MAKLRIVKKQESSFPFIEFNPGVPEKQPGQIIMLL